MDPPQLLPDDHHAINLFIVQRHVERKHDGVQSTLSFLIEKFKEKFWIVRGRQKIKKQSKGLSLASKSHHCQRSSIDVRVCRLSFTSRNYTRAAIPKNGRNRQSLRPRRSGTARESARRILAGREARSTKKESSK